MNQQKPWLWKKRSMEKTIFAVDKAVNPSRTIQEEVHNFPTEDGLEKSSSKSLNQKLASVLLDSHNADNTSEKLVQKSQDKIIGQDEATNKVESLQKEGDEELSKEVSVPKLPREHEKIQKELEEKLRENCRRLAEVAVENASLTNALQAKEKSIEDLLKYKHQKDEEYNTLVDRLDCTERENGFLRYEFHLIEKELEIQREEKDCSHQYADALHKQYQETVQKVAKLEAECQRLHLLLQKRSPQPAMVNVKNEELNLIVSPQPAMLNVKNEVGIMGGRERDTRRRRSNSTRDYSINNQTAKGNSAEASDKSIGLMIKRLQDLDEENKALKRILTKKNNELESSRNMYAQTATRLSQAEILLRKLSEDHKSMELSVISKFDIASDDEISSSGSWANALISELEHLRSGEVKIQKNFKAIQVSDTSFLNDFSEMEKGDIISVDTPKKGHCSDLIPENSFDWIQVVLNATLKQKRISKRSLDELLEDIRIALGCINPATYDKTQNSWHSEKSNQYFNSNLRNSICQIIKLIEGFAPMSFICNKKNQHSEIPQSPTSQAYLVHVFQWKISELNPLLHRLVHTCKDLLNGRADLENFAHEVAFALDWCINNRANPTNSSIARDKIKKHFSCHQSNNDAESEIGVDSIDKLSLCSPFVASPDDQSVFLNMKNNNQYDLIEENRKLQDELRNTESAKKNLEVILQEAQHSIKVLQSELETQKESNEIIEDQIEKQKLINEDLDTQLTISQAKLNDIFQKFSSLEVELEDKKSSCEELEATCLELQLQLESIAKKESPIHDREEVEKIYQSGWEITTASSKLAECQETILNLGKQLKALSSSSDRELLDSVLPKTSTMVNQTHKKNSIKRSSLRNRMLAEEDTKSEILKSPQIEENNTTRYVQNPSPLQSDKNDDLQLQAPNNVMISEQNDRTNAMGALAIVPTKKQRGFGFLRKLLFRKKGREKVIQSLAKA